MLFGQTTVVDIPNNNQEEVASDSGRFRSKASNTWSFTLFKRLHIREEKPRAVLEWQNKLHWSKFRKHQKKSTSNNFHAILIILNIFEKADNILGSRIFFRAFDVISRVYQINWFPEMKWQSKFANNPLESLKFVRPKASHCQVSSLIPFPVESLKLWMVKQIRGFVEEGSVNEQCKIMLTSSSDFLLL